MSWIVTSPAGYVFELYEPSNVAKARAAGWRVEEAGVYLGRLNTAVRAERLAICRDCGRKVLPEYAIEHGGRCLHCSAGVNEGWGGR